MCVFWGERILRSRVLRLFDLVFWFLWLLATCEDTKAALSEAFVLVSYLCLAA